MKITLSIFLLLVIDLFMITGCTTSDTKRPTTDPVEQALANAFAKIAASYEQLALIQSAQGQDDYRAQSYSYSEEDLPEQWRQELELLEGYHGDLVSFVEMLSIMAGIEKPRIVRSQAGQPIIIAVDKGKRPVIAFMADVGFQAGKRARLKPVVALNQILVEFSP